MTGVIDPQSGTNFVRLFERIADRFQSGRLTLRGIDRDEEAWIVFKSGMVEDARCGPATGEEAVRAMKRSGRWTYEFLEAGETPGAAGAVPVAAKLGGLSLKAVRVKSAEPVSTPVSVPVAAPAAAAKPAGFSREEVAGWLSGVGAGREGVMRLAKVGTEWLGGEVTEAEAAYYAGDSAWLLYQAGQIGAALRYGAPRLAAAVEPDRASGYLRDGAGGLALQVAGEGAQIDKVINFSPLTQ